MKDHHLKFTYINGPTALLEMSGLRLLTDPTFDPAGEEYPVQRRFKRTRIQRVLSNGGRVRTAN